jgi:ribosomal protein S18 acetylase RimI-like enzyme
MTRSAVPGSVRPGRRDRAPGRSAIERDGAMPLSIFRVTDPTAEAFAALVSLYEEAIPPSERKPAAAIRAMIDNSRYIVLLAQEDDRIVGFAISFQFPAGDLCLLEYMGVSGATRGRGLGSEMFRAVVACEHLGGRTLVLEVDSDHGPADDLHDRQRRKTFYRAAGCLEVEGLAYLMPRIGPRPPPAMDLMVYRRPQPDRLERRVLVSWLQDIYEHIYAARRDDENIAAMTRLMAREVGLI